jgi:anthranilate synthase component 1
MEIIDELEPEARGPYGGAIGYFSFSGDMDTCITIRTVVMKDGEASITAGAGIVADSDPATEVRETETKAAAMLQALGLAEALQARAGSDVPRSGASTSSAAMAATPAVRRTS